MGKKCPARQAHWAFSNGVKFKKESEGKMWKFKELDETQQKLLKSGIIDIGGSVDADMALYVREALLRLRAEGNPPVSLHITSSGGSVSIGLDIYDTIRLYLGQKTGIVTG